MHEMSIATALLERVVEHTPPGTAVRRVVIEAGPLQGLDPEAMRWAWQSVAAGSPCAGSTIEVISLPWKMRCAACGREWTAEGMADRCACGAAETYPIEGRELRLRSLDVDDVEKDDAGAGDRERPEAQR